MSADTALLTSPQTAFRLWPFPPPCPLLAQDFTLCSVPPSLPQSGRCLGSCVFPDPGTSAESQRSFVEGPSVWACLGFARGWMRLCVLGSRSDRVSSSVPRVRRCVSCHRGLGLDRWGELSLFPWCLPTPRL